MRRMGNAVSLPVLLPKIPGQRWACHSCGDCCRTLVVHLFPEECKRLDDQGWAEKLGAEPYVRAGRNNVLNKNRDGACVFLDDNTRCKIHNTYGEAAKPLACRMFPFSVHPVAKGWRASLRFDCPSVVASKGQLLSTHHAWLTHLAQELQHNAPVHDQPLLQRGIRATPDETDALVVRFRRWLRHQDRSVSSRLLGAARITATLAGASFTRVRGQRFIELVDLLFGALPKECARQPEPPTSRQRGMLFQLAFAHAEHLTTAELRTGMWGRARKRLRQLRFAKRFRVGRGDVPPLPGLEGTATFENVDAVDRPTHNHEDMNERLLRYVLARLESRTVFGAGYYDWPVISGLGALWLSVAVVGWLARYAAALDGISPLDLQHLDRALAIVDRAATRLPALGTVAERVRVTYLLNDDGVSRLVDHYSITGDQPCP
jgi:lysine-N-methylase